MREVLETGIVVLLISFIPGYLVVRSFAVKHSNTNLSFIETVFLSVLLSMALTGTIALFLAQIRFFTLPILAVILTSIVALLALNIYRQTRQLHGFSDGLHFSYQPIAWGMTFLVFSLAVVLFFHPHQYILGGGDAGVYINWGINLAKTGALLINEPILKDINPMLFPALLREQPAGVMTQFIRLPGFYLSDTTAGLIIPQFYPLQPTWIAIGYALFGITGALYVTPLWALLSVWAIYLLGRENFSNLTGWISALLLTIIPLQIYFARYPSAEPITQFYSIATLFTFSVFAQQRFSPYRALWGLAAGVAFGQIFLARIDAVPMMLLPIFWGIYLLVRRAWTKDEWWFWTPLVFFVGYAIYHGLVFSLPYTNNIYGNLFFLLTNQLKSFLLIIVITAVFLILSGIGFVRFRWKIICNLKQYQRHSYKLRYIAAFFILGVAIYGYFIRPQIGQTVFAQYWYNKSQIPVTNYENLVRLGWYLSPLGILLAVGGGVWMILSEPAKKMWLLWTIGGVFTIIYVYNILNNPYQIYAMRRYVPIVVPFFVIGMAYALNRLWGTARTAPKVSRWAVVFIGAILASWLMFNSRLILTHSDYQGAVEQIESISKYFSPKSIVLFVDNRPVGLGVTLGTPLQYIYGNTAFDLQEEMIVSTVLVEQIKIWQSQGYKVYMVNANESNLPLDEITMIHYADAKLELPYLEQTYTHVPAKIQTLYDTFQIYQIAN